MRLNARQGAQIHPEVLNPAYTASFDLNSAIVDHSSSTASGG
jgi:hypothetical protein